MEVNVTPPPPPPPPPSTYNLIGLTEDEALFLRDLCGQFSCNPPRGEDAHFHTRLFTQLDAALRDAQPEMQRASGKGVVHANTVARKLSRLSARIKALASA